MIIKVTDHDAYLLSYRLVGPNEFKVDLVYRLEDATQFEDDDYILHLCRRWFKKLEVTYGTD